MLFLGETRRIKRGWIRPTNHSIRPTTRYKSAAKQNTILYVFSFQMFMYYKFLKPLFDIVLGIEAAKAAAKAAHIAEKALYNIKQVTKRLSYICTILLVFEKMIINYGL